MVVCTIITFGSNSLVIEVTAKFAYLQRITIITEAMSSFSSALEVFVDLLPLHLVVEREAKLHFVCEIWGNTPHRLISV